MPSATEFTPAPACWAPQPGYGFSATAGSRDADAGSHPGLRPLEPHPTSSMAAIRVYFGPTRKPHLALAAGIVRESRRSSCCSLSGRPLAIASSLLRTAPPTTHRRLCGCLTALSALTGLSRFCWPSYCSPSCSRWSSAARCSALTIAPARHGQDPRGGYPHFAGLVGLESAGLILLDRPGGADRPGSIACRSQLAVANRPSSPALGAGCRIPTVV